MKNMELFAMLILNTFWGLRLYCNFVMHDNILKHNLHTFTYKWRNTQLF